MTREGNTLAFSRNADLDNTGRTFAHSTAAPAYLLGGTIRGGVIASADGRAFPVGNDPTYYSAWSTLRDVTLDSDLTVDRAYLRLQGNIGFTPGRRITLKSEPSAISTLTFPAGYVLDDVEIVFDSTNPVGSFNRSRIYAESNLLTFGPGVVVRTGTGTGGGELFAYNSTGTLRSRGLVLASNGGRLDVRQLVNEGTVRAQSGGEVSLERATNSGLVEARGGSVWLWLPTNIDAERRLVGGRWVVQDGSLLDISIGSVSANHADVTIAGPTALFRGFETHLTANAGKLALLENHDLGFGYLAMSNSGELILGEGSTLRPWKFTQDDAGLLTLLIGGTDRDAGFGSVATSGDVTIDGSLIVELSSGFTPVPGNTFTLVSGPSVAGTFDDVDLPELSAGWSFSLDYSPAAVTLTVVPEPASVVLVLPILLAMGRRVRRVSAPRG